MPEKIDSKIFNEIISFLRPQFSNHNNREAIVRKALFGCDVLDQIDWTGNADTFTIHLVDVLIQFGACDTGQPSVATLLYHMRKYVGNVQDEQINAIIAKIPGADIHVLAAQEIDRPQPSPMPSRMPVYIGAIVVILVLIGLSVFGWDYVNNRPDTTTVTEQPTTDTTDSLTVGTDTAAIPTLDLPQTGVIARPFSLFESADENSSITSRVSAGAQITIVDRDGEWSQVELGGGTTGWARSLDLIINTPVPEPLVTPISIANGRGARSDSGWQIFFTEIVTERGGTQSSCASNVSPGIDARLADAIDRTRETLDIAAFEFNNCLLTQVVLDAHERGVRVRIVTDDEYGLEDDGSTLIEFELAGIPIVNDERTSLMHNAFMILDDASVWTGSWDYTENATFRNSNNTLVFTSPAEPIVQSYIDEFNEMFERGEFGTTSTTGNGADYTDDNVRITTLFGPEDNLLQTIIDEINKAESSIHFMIFAFTDDSLGNVLMDKASDGVDVQGIFELTGSTTNFAELPRLICSGVPVRQDASPYILHHKVFVIDESIVITGSVNWTSNGFATNDENLLIIHDRALAARYLEEFELQWNAAPELTADRFDCS